MIVTAFGPFGNFSVNPSEVIGHKIFGDALAVLPVSYRAVDEFIDSVPPDTESLLMLGVASTSRQMRLERIARFAIGNSKDINLESREREGSGCLRGALFDPIIEPSDCWQESENAGGYLCNYIYYEATRRLPTTRTGFVHVAPFSAVSMNLQVCRLRRLFAKLRIV